MKKITLQSDVFTRGVEDIITREELGARLGSGKSLRVKLGIDATAPDLHIGHAVPLWKIRELQEAGHKAVIILGEFTTQIGDPTGKTQARPVLAREVIKKNIVVIKKQVQKILLTDSNHLEIRKNSEWFGKMKTAEFLRLLSMVTHARLIERDMFQERIKSGGEITMAEILYPILQGYDSFAINADLTIIGSDQLFNEHMGRFFQERFGQSPQSIVTMKILSGPTGGEKMSKSVGNTINLRDTPQDKFGKAMRVIDSLIVPYVEMYTDLPAEGISRIADRLLQGENPRDAKLEFAEALVRRYHGAVAAKKARQEFISLFSDKKLEDITEVSFPHGEHLLVDLLVGLGFAVSKSDAQRLIQQGAVEINEERMTDEKGTVHVVTGMIVKAGKRRFGRIR